jgi:hypothetical protein
VNFLKLLTVISLFFTTSCTLKTISLNKSNLTLIVGQKILLEATAQGDLFAPNTYEWRTSSETNCTVSSEGLITAKTVGSATITATSTIDNTKQGTCVVTIATTLTINNGTSADLTYVYWGTNSFGNDDVYDALSGTTIKGIKIGGTSTKTIPPDLNYIYFHFASDGNLYTNVVTNTATGRVSTNVQPSLYRTSLAVEVLKTSVQSVGLSIRS